ncbi:MAG: GHMP kinase [Lentisphaerae bacterium]|nr:GHMP kinase [Lentisphaerota bacterium]
MLITQTPLRISLAGGGTDLPSYYQSREGAVVSAAIDKYIYVILNRRFDEKIYISYSKKEIVDRVADIHHELVREALIKAGVRQGVEIAIMADIPSEGTGLGSSSSLTVGLLNAFYAYRGIQAPAAQLAEEACDIEVRILQRPMGKQDQYIAAFGGLRHFKFHPDERVTVEDLSAKGASRTLGERLLLFYTNVTRNADTILTEQKSKTGENLDNLDGIKRLASQVREAIQQDDFDRVGVVLNENWTLKKRLATNVSNPAIDEMVATALAGGATGCKVSGAGGGGFLLTYCPANRLAGLRKAMQAYREMPFFLERCGSKVIFNVESYEWIPRSIS